MAGQTPWMLVDAPPFAAEPDDSLVVDVVGCFHDMASYGRTLL
jgi:hypothetical protein